MLLWPLLFHDACINPLNSVYLAVQESSVRKVPWYLGNQLVAMAIGLIYSTLTWRLLSSLVSDVHLSFMSSQANPFLKVGMLQGFLLEMGMAFVMYLPRLVIRTGFTCTFISAVLSCAMIFLLEHTTGAFMNPLVALSSNLLWHYQSLNVVALSELFLVYWLAPTLGTLMAASLDVKIWRTHEKVQ